MVHFQSMRWLLALAGWLAPNILLILALGSIPPTQSTHPAGSAADWGAGMVVIPGFLMAFFAVGCLSVRLALHGAPDSARPGLARAGRYASLAWLALWVALQVGADNSEARLGFACLVLWGIGHLLGSRWRQPPPDSLP